MRNKLFAAIALAIASMAAAPAVDLIEKTTVKTVAEDQKLATELFALGPAGIADICGQVIPLGSGDDTKARMAIAAMVRQATAPGQEKNRAALAGASVAGIEKNNDPEVKLFFVYQLRFVGKDESVDTLAKLLADEKNQLCPTAVMSLVAINTPKAADAVAAALGSAPKANLVTLLTAAGTLRAKSAEAAIVSHLDDADKAVRHAARYAAAQIGLPQVAAPLSKAAVDASLGQLERSEMVAMLFVYAQRRAEAGAGAEASEICQRLLKAEPQDPNVRCGALHTLVGIEKEKALPAVLAAFDSPDSEFRNAGLMLAEKLPGAENTAKYVEKLAKAEPDAKADIVAMLGRRGDPAALAAVTAAMADKTAGVRLAAYATLPRLAGEQTVSQLLKTLATADASDIAKLSEVIARQPGEKALGEIAAALPKVPAGAQESLLDVLANRGAKTQAAVVLASAKSETPAVRLAALKAMAKLASAADTQALIDLAVAAKDEPEEAAAIRAAVAASLQITPADKQADALIAAMTKASGAKRTALTRALAKIGGAPALAAVQGELAKSADAALRTLAEWPDAAALPELLKQAKAQTDVTPQVIALRGAINLTRTSSMSSTDKIKTYTEAMALCRRPDEKKQIFGALATERSLPSLELAASGLDDPATRAEAAIAAVTIALPEKGAALKGDKVLEILTKATPLCPDAKLKDRAQQYLNANRKK